MSSKPRDKGKTKEKPNLNRDTAATKRQRTSRTDQSIAPRTYGKVDVARVLTLRFKHKLPLEAIAADQKVSPQAIAKHLKKFERLLDAPQIEDNHLAQMFKAAAVEHLCAAVEPTKVKKLSADKNALSACMLLDKSRLISGQSTQNIAVMMASAVLDADATVTETATEAYEAEGKTIVVS